MKKNKKTSKWVDIPIMYVYLSEFPDTGTKHPITRAVFGALVEIGIPVKKVSLGYMKKRVK